MSDYLAIIYIASGSSHGRAPNKEKAIANAIHFFRDWEGVFKIPEQNLSIEVWDVQGYGEVSWGPNGARGFNLSTQVYEKIDRVPEIVTRPFRPRKSA